MYILRVSILLNGGANNVVPARTVEIRDENSRRFFFAFWNYYYANIYIRILNVEINLQAHTHICVYYNYDFL